MPSTAVQRIATVLFALAISHTFLVKRFHRLAGRFPRGSVAENLFQLLGEVEIVFGAWAALLLAVIAIMQSPQDALTYLDSQNFTEPTFVFVILAMCSTRPVLDMAEGLISSLARLIPLRPSISFYAVTLTVGPILGSFITEPAAMTVTSLLLLQHYFQKEVSSQFKYATIGLLFVNISIGGTLTPFAAPPLLMVAAKWGWDLPHMLTHFGYKGVLACLISTLIVTLRYHEELSRVRIDTGKNRRLAPIWIRVCHLVFLGLVVASAHHTTLMVGLFLFFLGFVQVTLLHQDPIRLKEGLLVSFFLGGLVVLGGMQGWWLEPLLARLTTFKLFTGAIALTAFTDNAALTYLGTLAPDLADSSKYALVAGAVVGGGLTVIANAPNPVGYSILHPTFGKSGISPLGLLGSALLPTMVAGICFWLL